MTKRQREIKEHLSRVHQWSAAPLEEAESIHNSLHEQDEDEARVQAEFEALKAEEEE